MAVRYPSSFAFIKNKKEAGMKIWLGAKEVAKLLSMTRQSVWRRAARENWQSRLRQGRGGGREYHISSLPALVQNKLNDSTLGGIPPVEPVTNPPVVGSFLWERWESASQKHRKIALRYADAIKQIIALTGSDHNLSQAVEAISSQTKISSTTLKKFYYRLKRHDQTDWAALCLPSQYQSDKQAERLIDDAAWEFFKADYLRPEQPAITACYHRMRRMAKSKGWRIPHLRSMYRLIDKIPTTTRVIAREGEVALRRLYPSVERDKTQLSAMEWINGDGYQHNVFVKLPNGKVGRPKTWFWQDVYSGKILAFRTAETESSCQIRLAFADVVEHYGIPQHITIDNTRAAANKFLTGGVPNRYRFKVKDTDPLGLFPALGIQIHWTSVVATMGKAKGWGQAKPVERAFGIGGIGEVVDKHPAFAGAYTGADTTKKPENYQSKAVAIDDFMAVLEVEIDEWNVRRGRRTAVCFGELSFDEAFSESYANTQVIKATEEQRRMFLLEAEAVKVRHDATVVLSAGSVQGYGQNRYHCAELYNLIGKLVTVRFDPDHLYKDIYIYKQSGEFIAQAECLVPAGFGDKDTAREVSRERRRMVKATKEALEAERRMAVAEVADELADITPREPEKTPSKIIAARFKTHQIKKKPAVAGDTAPLIDWNEHLPEQEQDDESLNETEQIFLDQADA